MLRQPTLQPPPDDRKMTRLRSMLAALFCMLLPALSSAEEIIQLPSADGATLPYLFSADLPAAAAKPEVAAILFNGGEGVIGLREKGIPQPGANFLVRTRARFVARGIPVALIDVPSDSRGMSDRFRMSRRHFDDIESVANDLQKRFPGTRLFLIGTSRGTVSAAYAGAALAPRLAGVVLTSSLFSAPRDGSALAGFDFAEIHVPLLFVHHVDDACRFTPYYTARSLSEKYPLISVRGGKEPRSGPCDPFHAHGYYGKEEETINAIANWMLGKPYATVIE